LGNLSGGRVGLKNFIRYRSQLLKRYGGADDRDYLADAR
jgi:hypothetical protein